MCQKHKRFRESRMPFPLRDIRKNPRSMYARVPQAMAQFVLKIEKLSHIMGPTPILEMARAYGLPPRLWLLDSTNKFLFIHYLKIFWSFGSKLFSYFKVDFVAPWTAVVLNWRSNSKLIFLDNYKIT